MGNLSLIKDVEVDKMGEAAVSTKNSQYVLYLKKAKMDWKTSLGKFVFGMQGRNVFGVQGQSGGYGEVEKSPLDLHKFSSSADMGTGVYSALNANIHYSVR